MMVGLAGLFVFLAVSVRMQWTQGLDERLVRALRAQDDVEVSLGPVWMPGLMRDLTALAGVGLVVVLAAVMLVYFLLRRWWLSAGVLALVFIGAQASVTTLKLLFSRPRPDFLTHLQEMHTHSFPSGHSALGSAMLLTLAWSLSQVHQREGLRTYFWSCASALIIVIGFTRMYLGVHYPTDILAGWCIGGFWATAGWVVYQTASRRSAESPAVADGLALEADSMSKPSARAAATEPGHDRHLHHA